jgi:ATP-dependent RNA helicase DeaD|tara:strand:+ start:25879 stop:27654 length:1776 start_codon:yes stop_codon:yes gene_type:complete
MTFSDLPAGLANALAERGYEAPTPVQAAVLDPDLRERDLIVSAQTGSGKTVAFGLAFSAQILGSDGQVQSTGKPGALVIAPTRELALQVSRELTWLYQNSKARVVSCVGGMNPSQERRELKSGATIVVGTPGRLRDHLERGTLDLSELAAVVLDEADEMLDMGFREELEEILDAAPETRRTLLFSATMPRPMEALARRYQRDALRIATGGGERGHNDIAYQAVTVAPSEIENAVINLLRFHEADTAILFCATRENVRHLHATLQERGFSAVALSGEHSQSERNQALQALRDRRASVCVATDVAARGLDLPNLSLVIHVEIPRDAETLQHRSGRTGRAGKKGTAVIVVPFPRRRRVESMLRNARINAEWIDAPDREAILAMDRERLLKTLLMPVEVDETDRKLAERLLNERTPQELAAMLIQAHRAKMPEPEELLINSPEAQAAARKERQRPGFDDVVWFRMDIGRQQKADPRWLLPLLCRRGHISRNQIGAIRIGPRVTHFQIPRAAADKFADALGRTAGDENGGDVHIELSPDAPQDSTRPSRNNGPSAGRKKGASYAKKPHKDRPANSPERNGVPGKKPKPRKPKKRPV